MDVPSIAVVAGYFALANKSSSALVTRTNTASTVLVVDDAEVMILETNLVLSSNGSYPRGAAQST
jgi:hypothetical protein